MKESTTKKSLKSSGLALFVCIVMLIGTTFAWFTDSITNRGNSIQSGTLDIGATAYDLGEGGVSVTIPEVNGGKAFIFDAKGRSLEDEKASPIISDTLWEPGKSNAKLLKVENKGTLAAKIKLGFNVKTKTLEEFLWFDFVQLGENNEVIGGFTKRPMSELSNLADGVEVKLESGKNVKFVLVYGMDESVGNEAQKKSFNADVTIVATQLNKETDGFGNDNYDKNAVYPVGSNSSFEEAMNSAKPNDTIKVAPGMYKMPKIIPEGVTILGEGKEKTQIEPQATEDGNNKTGIIINKPGIIIKDAYIRSIYGITISEYQGIFDISRGTVLESLKIEKTKEQYSAIVIKSIAADEEVTISNCEMEGKFKAINIVDGANGTVNIINSEIKGVYPISVNSSSSKNLVINVKGSKLRGWTSYGDIRLAKFTNTEFGEGTKGYNFIRPYADTTWEQCSFNEGLTIGAGATGKTYIINNCTKDGEKITAANIKTIGLFDMEGNDGINLKGCTIIVDGTKVEL